MICSECRKHGQRSRVYIIDSYYDLQIAQDRFFDEEGHWHVHDTNTSTTTYQCTNNHKWSETKYSMCWCEKTEM